MRLLHNAVSSFFDYRLAARTDAAQPDGSQTPARPMSRVSTAG